MGHTTKDQMLPSNASKMVMVNLTVYYYINCRDTSAATSKPAYIHKYVELSTIYTFTLL